MVTCFPSSPIEINGKCAPIVATENDGKLGPIETVNRFPSWDGIIDPETDDLPRENDRPDGENGSTAKSGQSSAILPNKSSKNPNKAAKRPTKPSRKKEPKTGKDLAKPVLSPKAQRKSLETRRRNAQLKKQNAAQQKKERGERAIATGGRVTKTGRIYEAESLQRKKDAMRSVTLQRLEDEVAEGRCITRNLTAPAGTDLNLPDKYRSLTENLLFTFLENHKEALQYTALYYPERDYPHDCHDWSVTPYGKLVPWVRDFDMLNRFDGEPDFWLQFQGSCSLKKHSSTKSKPAPARPSTSVSANPSLTSFCAKPPII